MESGTFGKQEGLVLIMRKTEDKKGSQSLLSFSLLLLSVIVVQLSSKVNKNQIRRLIYEIKQYHS